MADLQGRVALVTGGGRGIGRATAESLARAGASVVIATRSEGPGRDTLAAIESFGGSAILVAEEIATRAAVKRAVDAAIDRYSRLDIILHNAAYVPYVPIMELTDEDLSKVIDVQLKAAFWFAQEGFPYLKQSPAGRLLFTSSLSGNQMGHVDLAHYSATKSAINGFIKSAALEFAQYGITVNAIEPGLTATDVFGEGITPEAIEKMGKAVPVGRAAEPADIAAFFLFLASDAAGYMTGRSIVVDGGLSLGTTRRLPRKP